MNKKIGISCRSIIKQYGVERGLEICKESGFDSVDFVLTGYTLNGPLYSGSEDEFVSFFTAVRKKSR